MSSKATIAADSTGDAVTGAIQPGIAAPAAMMVGVATATAKLMPRVNVLRASSRREVMMVMPLTSSAHDRKIRLAPSTGRGTVSTRKANFGVSASIR